MIFEKVFQTASRSSMTVGELRTVLGNIQHLCLAAGAKTAVKDLEAFSEMLKPYSDMPVDKACADIKRGLSQPAKKPTKRATRAGSSTSVDPNLIQQHLTELREAGTNQHAFDLALKKLKASNP